MPERKCDWEPNVKKTDGKMSCPDLKFTKFKLVENCVSCPKNQSYFIGVNSEADRATNAIRYGKRNLRY